MAVEYAIINIYPALDKPTIPVFQAEPLMTAYRAQTATPRLAALLLGLFSALAAALACVGIYGVLSFAVGQRSQEIAVRRAIGATAPRVAWSVVGDGLKLTAVGLIVGGVASTVSSRILDSFLFEVEATDPMTFLSVGGSMVLVALFATVVPALRAIQRDPAEALNVA